MNRTWFIVIGIFLVGLSGCGRRFRLSPEQMAEPSAWPFYRGGVAALGSFENGDFDGRLDVVWEQRSGDKPGGPLALHYGVELWSEEHWRMIDTSLRMAESIGNKTLYIPLITRTNFGNTQTMVRWVAQPDRSHKLDFTIAEKYIDVATKHLGKIPIVCLAIYD